MSTTARKVRVYHSYQEWQHRAGLTDLPICYWLPPAQWTRSKARAQRTRLALLRYASCIDLALTSLLSSHRHSRKRRSEVLSTFARRMKAEREAHEHRIANMNRRITEYHNKVRALCFCKCVRAWERESGKALSHHSSPSRLDPAGGLPTQREHRHDQLPGNASVDAEDLARHLHPHPVVRARSLLMSCRDDHRLLPNAAPFTCAAVTAPCRLRR